MSDSSPRIALFGEALVDVFANDEVLGGAPFNVSRNLAAFGARPLMVTRVGMDARGDRIVAEFLDNGMDVGALQRDPVRPTGEVTVRLREGEPSFHIKPDAAWDYLSAAELLPVLRSAAPALVYFGTLGQRGECSRRAIREGIAATSARRFLDLNLRGVDDERTLAAESLELADIVKVNEAELNQLLGWFVNLREKRGDAGADADIAGLMRRFDLQRVVVTRGAQGWSCHEGPDGDVLHGAAMPAQVRDTVGAGDAFASVLLLGELLGWPLAGTLERAAEFAAAVCGVRGGFIGADAARALGISSR